MADIQYLAAHSASDKSWTSLYNKVILRQPEKKEFFDQDVPLFLPPPIFSRLDSSVDYYYRPDTQHKSVQDRAFWLFFRAPLAFSHYSFVFLCIV